MSLTVDPFALRRYGFVLGQAADDTVIARNYATTYGQMSWSTEGFLSLAQFVHTDFVQTLTSTLNHLYDVLHASQSAMHQTAGYYEHAELAAAAQTDANYPAVPRDVNTPW